MSPSIRRSAGTDKLAERFASHTQQASADAVAAARAVCEAFGGGVHAGGGIPKVAELIGTSPGVLYNKLAGAEGSHHKLTVLDMQLIHLATGRIEHLQAQARGMNCVAFPVPDLSKCSDEALIELLAKVQEEGGQYHHLLRHCLQDGEIERGELAALTKEVYEWVGAIVEAHSRVKGLARV